MAGILISTTKSRYKKMKVKLTSEYELFDRYCEDESDYLNAVKEWQNIFRSFNCMRKYGGTKTVRATAR